MLRIVLLISLLASLILMIRQFTIVPLTQVQETPVRSRTRPLPPPGSAGVFGNKPAMRVAPAAADIYDHYLFVEDRKLDESDFGEFGGGQETSEAGGADLDQVFYAGSVIVGERRQGLIIYQENNRAARQPDLANPTLIRGRTGAAGATSGEQKKVLVPGDRFKGFQVTAIEPDKIVFERGGEKVEKFLFDQNKKRQVVTGQPGTALPPGQGATGTTMAPSPTRPSPGVRIVPPGGTDQAASSPAARPGRSRRFPMGYPTTRLPIAPAAPGRPVSPNNQSEP